MDRTPVRGAGLLGVMRGRDAIERPLEAGDAGVVHQHVEGGKPVGHGVPIGFGRDVEPRKGRAKGLRHVLAGRDVDVGEDDVCAFVAEGAGDGGTDAARPPGHEGGLMMQSGHEKSVEFALDEVRARAERHSGHWGDRFRLTGGAGPSSFAPLPEHSGSAAKRRSSSRVERRRRLRDSSATFTRFARIDGWSRAR